MKLVKRVLLVALALICAAGMTACADKPADILALVDKGDFEGAREYFEDEIEGTFKEKDICDEIADEMEDRYSDITDMCFEGEYDEDDIENLIGFLDDIGIEEEDYEDDLKDWERAFESKQNYEDALDYIDDGDYESAIAALELVDKDDSDYDKVQEKIEEIEYLQFENTAQSIEEMIATSDDEDIHIVFEVIAGYDEVYSDDDTETQRLDELYSMAEDALILHISQLLDESRCEDARFVLVNSLVNDETYDKVYSMIEAEIAVYAQTCVDQYFAEYNYYDAKNCIELLLNDYEECNELMEIYANLEDAYVQKVIEDAEEYVLYEYTDYALDILLDAMGVVEYGSDGYNKLFGMYEELNAPVIEEADTNAVTFEDGRLYTAYNIDVDDEGKGIGDASGTNLTVEEYNGSMMLKIEVLEQDGDGIYKIPKIGFDVDALVGPENVDKIKSFQIDMYQVAVGPYVGEDGTEVLCPANFMGGFGGYSPTTENPTRWISFGDFAAAEWTLDWVYTQFQGKILLDNNRFEKGQTGCSIVLMRWGMPNQADIYIDNITFFDEDGNSIPIVY